MVYNFISLYTKVRSDTLFGLDQLPQLQNAHSLLKTKILFSIIVLAFRSCTSLRDRKMIELRRLFNPTATTTAEQKSNSPTKVDFFASVEKAARQYLQDTSDKFPLEDVAAQVSNQVSVRRRRMSLIKCHQVTNRFPFYRFSPLSTSSPPWSRAKL